MTDTHDAWNRAGDQLADLGRKLKTHYEQARGDEQEQRELEDALRRLGDAVQGGFDAVAAAARDQAVRDDVLQVGQSVAEAVKATAADVTDELRKAFGRKEG